MLDKSNRRRSLGGNRSNPTLQAANASEELRHIQSFIDKDEREIVHVTPLEIKKTFNARFIPCSLEEFGKIEWPDLSNSVDEAKEKYPTLLAGHGFWESLNDIEKEDFTSFLVGVHSTSTSMVNELQIHPITLERETPESTEYFIVDGERRSLSALYARGKIPVVKAYVYNRRLKPLERALLKDSANTGVPLTIYETLLSKYEIYVAYEGAKSLTVRDLGQLIGYKRDLASTIKRVFDSEDRDQLLERVRREKLGWREIRFLLQNGVDEALPSKEETKSVENESQKKLSDRRTKVTNKNPDIVSLEERIARHVGFPCSIGFNEGSGNVKVSFSTNLTDFENLLANLKRLDVKKVLDK